MAIDAIEKEVKTNGEVRDYGVYEESDDGDTENVETEMSLNARQGTQTDLSDLPGMIHHDSLNNKGSRDRLKMIKVVIIGESPQNWKKHIQKQIQSLSKAVQLMVMKGEMKKCLMMRGQINLMDLETV